MRGHAFFAARLARLLRNFTSRFNDGALAFTGIIFTAGVVASASADDGALPLLTAPVRRRGYKY
mgnify:CR=1 FL=1